MDEQGQCQRGKGWWRRRVRQDPWTGSRFLQGLMSWKRGHGGEMEQRWSTVEHCTHECRSLPQVFLKHGADVPRWAEGGEASAETFVVNGSCVDGEESHQQNQIPSSKHHPPDLEQKQDFISVQGQSPLHYTTGANILKTSLNAWLKLNYCFRPYFTNQLIIKSFIYYN